MNLLLRLAVISMVCIAFGCVKRTSLNDSMADICSAPSRVKDVVDTPAEKAVGLGQVLDDIGKSNPAAEKFLNEVMGGPQEQKADRLRAAAKQAGLKECSLADVFTLPGSPATK